FERQLPLGDVPLAGRPAEPGPVGGQQGGSAHENPGPDEQASRHEIHSPRKESAGGGRRGGWGEAGRRTSRRVRQERRVSSSFATGRFLPPPMIVVSSCAF